MAAKGDGGFDAHLPQLVNTLCVQLINEWMFSLFKTFMCVI